MSNNAFTSSYVSRRIARRDGSGLCRREFLRHAAAAAAGVAITSRLPCLAGSSKSDKPRDAQRSFVVEVRSEHVLTPRGIHEEVVFDLLGILLAHLTGQADHAASWQSILKKDDVLALNFSPTGADGLGTADAMLRAMVRSLAAAGFDPARIVTIGVSPAIRQETKTQAPKWGWTTDELDFASGRDRLVAWLDDVTAIINVPFLMDHNIAGLSCSLFNLSHTLIKHPAQFYADGCSPFVADIVALPAVRSRLRLHVVNGLRVVFDGGPEVAEDFTWDAGMLMGGFDPVAVDTIGLQTLNRVRGAVGLSQIGGPAASLPYLEAAMDRGLGTCRPFEINLRKVKL